MNNKVILVDADGVLLDWAYSFDQWMHKHGKQLVDLNQYNIESRYSTLNESGSWYVRVFNDSVWIRKIPPYKDAIKYIRKLHEEHGYVFHVISSLSDDEYAQHLRTKNLRELFGPSAIEKFTYLDTGADKLEALIPYKDSECYWIDDLPKNAALGVELGLNSILMNHRHNSGYSHNDVTNVDSWKEIYDIIVGVS